MTRFDNGISIVDLDRRARDRTRADVQSGTAEHHTRKAFPVRRHAHVVARRLRVRELPHLRRPRRSRVGPRRSRWLGLDQSRALHHSGSRSDHRLARFPPDESADDDAEPSRHGQPRADALARRSDGRQRRAASAQPDTGTFDEDAAFKKFNVAFDGLLGRGFPLTDDEMQAFTDFILQVTYPPNPIRNLDNSLTPIQAAGRAFYFNALPTGQEIPSDAFHNCNGCHTLDLSGNAAAGVAKPGFFGTDGRYSFENEPQFLKVPHLRNMYQKVGMFGVPNNFGLPIDNPPPKPPLVSFLPPPLNDPSFRVIRSAASAFRTPASVDTIFRFVGASVFVQRPPEHPFPNPGGIPPTPQGIAIRRGLEAFMLAYDSNLAPIVGQQVTLTSDNAAEAGPRIDLLEQRAAAGECELVVRTRRGFREAGFLYEPTSATFLPDRTAGAALTAAQLRALADDSPLTFTAVPPGSGTRIAHDRHSDGNLDGDFPRF